MSSKQVAIQESVYERLRGFKLKLQVEKKKDLSFSETIDSLLEKVEETPVENSNEEVPAEG